MKTIEFDFDNVGGLSDLYLIESSAISAINTNVTNGKVMPVISSDALIYHIKVYGGNDFKFSEQAVNGETGTIYNVDISGFIPRLNNLVDVSILEKKEWIAIHQDCNGDILISGTRDVPLKFISNKVAAPDRNATSFSLQATCANPSQLVEEALLDFD